MLKQNGWKNWSLQLVQQLFYWSLSSEVLSLDAIEKLSCVLSVSLHLLCLQIYWRYGESNGYVSKYTRRRSILSNKVGRTENAASGLQLLIPNQVYSIYCGIRSHIVLPYNSYGGSQGCLMLCELWKQKINIRKNSKLQNSFFSALSIGSIQMTIYPV